MATGFSELFQPRRDAEAAALSNPGNAIRQFKTIGGYAEVPHVTTCARFRNGEDEWSGALRSTARRNLSLSEPYYVPMCSSAGKDTDRPNFVLAAAFRGTAPPTMVGWLAASQRTFPIYGNFSWWRFSAAALAAGAPSRSRPLIEQDSSRFSFQFWLWNRKRASQRVFARNLFGAARRGMACSTSADLSAVDEQCLAHPLVAGCVVTDAPGVVNGSGDLRHGPSRSWFPDGPCSVFRRTQRVPPQILDRHPRLNQPAPKLTPTCAHP